MDRSSELSFFTTLVHAGSLTAAAREMDISTAAVSKRLAQMEARLGVTLIYRTTRSIRLSQEGEIYVQRAHLILADIEETERLVTSARTKPKGLLRVNATLGFGRSYVAPMVSTFSREFPEIEVILTLSDYLPGFEDDSCDIAIRFGPPPNARVIARRIAGNKRLLCASPAYFNHYGRPDTPGDLARHNCIVLRQDETPYGIWRLSRNGTTETFKAEGTLASNDGEVVLQWALADHGILMRAEWDIAKYLRSGRLQCVLEDYELPSADIHVLYPVRHQGSARVKAFADFVVSQLARQTESEPSW